jgi:hypothetical protein
LNSSNKIERWKQLAEGATEGPLQVTTSSRGYFLRTEEQYIATLEYGPDKEKTLNDVLLFGVAREAVLELIAEMVRLKDMMYCLSCGGDVDDPQIDEYGEGPFCESCFAEMEEEDTP